MACFRSSLHTLAGMTRDLSDLMSRLNRSCFADSYGGRHFTTVFLAEYSTATGSIAYINAGHNPPLLRRHRATRNRRLALWHVSDATYEMRVADE